MSENSDMEIDNDSVAACKTKLLQFRIKELKDVLSQVGLSKQGRKQDLTDRILALLYDEGTPGLYKNNVNGKEGLIEIIEATYRNMQESVTSDSNTRKHNSSSSSRLRPKEEVDESQFERKLRCPCGSDLPNDVPLVQCVDRDCNIWQHINCVIIPERLMETIPTPTQFLCEICRVKRSDPFWAAMAHPLYPVKLVPSSIPVDGTNPHVSVEKSFKLTRVDRDLLQKAEFRVQVWCMLVNDIVPFRIQWPQYADLQVNGNPVKTVSRPSSQQLGANGRDNVAEITSCIMEGVNKISLSFTDARNFCFGVRLVRRRTLEQVFGMIPKETDGEPLGDALARIHRCIGGGITADDADSDSDLEVIADSVPVSLRCPMSGSRMKTAGRFRSCAHMGCFDLETLVGINERTRKWQCPICLKNYSLEDIIVDPFFNHILQMVGSCPEEINEIDLKPDGSWRVKKARDSENLAKWHRPDGSVEEFLKSDIRKEYALECNTLAVNMQNNAVDASLMNQGNGEAENQAVDIITMSSTTTGNGKDDGNPSINQDATEQLGFSNTNEPEVSSALKFFGQNHGCPAPDADIIVLSDSDDDDVSLIYPESVPVVSPPYHEGHLALSAAKVLNSFSADVHSEGPSASSRSNDDHFTPQSSRPHSLGASGIHFDTSRALPDDNNSASCAGHNNANLSLEKSTNPVSHVADSVDPQNGTFDHRLPSVNGGISLDVLPCPPVSRDELSLVNNSCGDHQNFSNAGGNGHEISSRNVEAQHESACEVLGDLQNQSKSEEGPLIQRTDGDSGSISPSASGSDLSVRRKRHDSPFSFPRQKRSTRRRVHQASSSSILPK
ncbi:E3 SUMO-protein ligase SIZ1 [Silene latifolia]|uniref:E3 SUMO-protein ligase SIZ1 n=1 Tax=Silene latifolia TaxID=37657 RepID=UPI003D780687